MRADQFSRQYSWKQISSLYVESVERLGAASL